MMNVYQCVPSFAAVKPAGVTTPLHSFVKHRHKGALQFWTRHGIHAGWWLYKEVELWQRQIPAATPTARILHSGTAPCYCTLPRSGLPSLVAARCHVLSCCFVSP
ncbi:hypothetical protein E2C01_064790 [Portunus trituberculatus]|uniref:Uncharacterized protein n=1 Tax=Portunus trituberculatus TaxID=210409 RepID=A0A5B7HLA4_PORTR|nr:hypothetical protein [Portunus trituberculatus]